MTVIAVVITIGPGHSLAPAGQENVAHVGPGYENNQQSQKTLTFTIPQGWVRDGESAKKFGVHTVLVPSGMKFENADKVITIAFQRQDSKKPGPENLKNFVTADLQDTLAQFPDAQFAKWQPSKLDPDKLGFWSLEIYGKERNNPLPQRFLILDAGDGFFSVSLTTKSRDELKLSIYEDFFNSLGLAPHN
jgi:hypothetical protein